MSPRLKALSVKSITRPKIASYGKPVKLIASDLE
jgi:hypothetical protein